MAIKRKQGDALWAKVKAVGAEVISAVWETWDCDWAIVKTLGQAPLLSGTSERTATMPEFIVRVTSTQMATLTPGKYKLVCQARNSAVDYKQEFIHEDLEIGTQGIV